MNIRSSGIIKAAVVCAILVTLAALVSCNLSSSAGPGHAASAAPAPVATVAVNSGSPVMLDVAFVFATVGFFAVSVLYVYGCGRL